MRRRRDVPPRRYAKLAERAHECAHTAGAAARKQERRDRRYEVPQNDQRHVRLDRPRNQASLYEDRWELKEPCASEHDGEEQRQVAGAVFGSRRHVRVDTRPREKFPAQRENPRTVMMPCNGTRWAAA